MIPTFSVYRYKSIFTMALAKASKTPVYPPSNGFFLLIALNVYGIK